MNRKLTRREAAQSILAQAPDREAMLERMPWLAVANKPQRAKAKPKQDEAILQIACVKLLRSLPGTMVWSCPNHLYLGAKGGYGQKMGYMARQKAMGLMPGASDLIVIFQSVHEVLTVVLPELKVPGNNLSDSQVEFARQSSSLGCCSCVIYSVDELVAVLRDAGHPSFQS